MSTMAFDRPRQATSIGEIRGRFDPWLTGVVVVLASFGVVMVGSAAIAGAGMDVGPWYYLSRHVVFLAIGIGLAIVAMRTELKTLEKNSQWLLIGCGLLLVLVLIPGIGKSVNGSRRWLNLGVANFQVVEAVKLLYILWLASYLKRYSEEVAATWPAMLKPLGVAIFLVVLLLVQPDFGSSSLLLAVTAGMMLLGGVNMPRMFGLVLAALPAAAALVIFEPYRLRRFTSVLDPWADPFNSGYQLTNALMAVGRGEWFGVGLGASVQKLAYLPEAHTDFIMAVIAEELGFVGVCAVVGLYALLAGRALWLGLRCVEMRRHFSGYIAFGIGLWLWLQSFVSIGVNLGMLPTKGLTLPLISSGGSSVLMTCAALGVLLRVSYEYDRAVRQVAHRRELSAELSPSPAPLTPAPSRTVVEPNARSSARPRPRVEPSLGRTPEETSAQAALRRAR